jgi:hypothetical protein
MKARNLLSLIALLAILVGTLSVPKTVFSLAPPPASDFRIPFVGGNPDWFGKYKITRGDCPGHITSGGGTPIDPWCCDRTCQ